MRLPRGIDQDVLYLDYDGVLHHEDVWWKIERGAYMGPKAAAFGSTLFEHAPLLIDLLKPYSHLKIVLSTSWVVKRGYSRALKRLPAELQQRVIGATYHSAMSPWLFIDPSPEQRRWVHETRMPRGLQIWADVVRRKPRAWLAVDDESFNWPAWSRHQLVCSDEAYGIAHPAVLDELKQKLKATFERSVV